MEKLQAASIPYSFRHIVHSCDAAQAVTTAHLRAEDMFLLYQLGRDLVQRQFRTREGTADRAGELSVPLYVGAPRARPARFARDHASGCGMCHSMPAHEPGAGQTIASTGGRGRNTPHFYGAGIVEMIAQQTRQLVLERFDTNRNGFIDRAEAAGSVQITPAEGVAPIDYGELTPGPRGVPRLNPVFRVWYADAAGRTLPGATSLDDARVAGFDFALQVFGWGRGYHRDAHGRSSAEGAEAATLRGIFAAAADVHMGLRAHDPTQQRGAPFERVGPGTAQVSLNGALQFDFDAAPDRGGPRGVARAELTQGDLDAAEFYMLHAPAPAVRATATSAAGQDVLRRLGCVRCHVEDWQLEARDAARGLTGDRRLFRLEPYAAVDADGVTHVLARLVRSARRDASGAVQPLGAAFRAQGVYSDFKHWDLGPAFHERRFDGTLQRVHRTAPLWGVSSTAPYGHDGGFMTLEDVIAAHDGDAAAEGAAFRRLAGAERAALLEHLDSLTLYATDRVPADVDGDGRVTTSLRVDGQDVGYERFDARLLFAVAPRFWVLERAPDVYVDDFPLMLLENTDAAHRLDLPYRRNTDGDAHPDPPGDVTCARTSR